jgi:phosphatidate cytidylyltransferase
MLLRILTSVVLIPLVLALVWWGPPALFAAVAGAIAILALVEFFELGERLGLRAFRKWTFVCAAGLFYAQYSAGLVETYALHEGVSLVRNTMGALVSVETVLIVFVLGAAGICLATRRPLGEVLPAISVGSGGLLFIGLPFSYIVRIDEISRVGRELVVFTLIVIWVGDMLAYFVGHGLGRLPLAPALSPKKTWEGSIGNLLGSLVVAVFLARLIQIDVLTLLIIAGLANVAGQMGDLLESSYKRGAGVKDSGTLLPGHGGMLDRIDSLVLASPVVWILCQWLVIRTP